MGTFAWDLGRPLRTAGDVRDATEAGLALLVQARADWAYDALLAVYGQLRQHAPTVAEALDDRYRAWAGR